jgi:hypothetical protein
MDGVLNIRVGSLRLNSLHEGLDLHPTYLDHETTNPVFAPLTVPPCSHRAAVMDTTGLLKIAKREDQVPLMVRKMSFSPWSAATLPSSFVRYPLLHS